MNDPVRPSLAKYRKYHVFSFMIIIAFIFISFSETFLSMFHIWYTSEAFQHGMLIMPISLYVIWLKRHKIKLVSFNVNYYGLVAVFFLCLLWLLGDIAGVQLVKHFVVMSLFSSVVLTCFGFSLFKTLLFPLGYLLLAIPLRAPFVYPLQQVTADMVYFGLQLTNIPVFREGQLVHIPAGTFEVAEACSGINFLTAMVTLSILFSYLTYRSYKKRFIFLMLSIIVPVIANGLRAYFIVLAGHFISMDVAGGADHIIFGWQFFGVIMLLMFWVGHKYADHEESVRS